MTERERRAYGYSRYHSPNHPQCIGVYFPATELDYYHNITADACFYYLQMEKIAENKEICFDYPIDLLLSVD